jgi:hypothetical protein
MAKGTAKQAGNQAEGTAEKVRESDALDLGIRVGLVAYGVVHLVIAFLAIQLALGDREGNVSSTGALAQIAEQPFGVFVLWVIGIGMIILVAWRLIEAVVGPRDESGDDKEWGSRIGAALKAVIYGVLGYSALRVATSGGGGGGGQGGSGGGGGSSSSGVTGTVMGWPGGQWLIAAAGLAVIGYACYEIYIGLNEEHAEKLASEGKSGEAGRAYLLLGKVGYCAKGGALLLVGGLIVWAGATHSSGKSQGGLDQALTKLLGEPFGPWLVGLIGLGLGCYGLFCFARARHLSQ